MIRSTRTSLLSLAALALTGSFALAQPTTAAPPAPSTAPAPAAPIQRQAPPARLRTHGPGMPPGEMMRHSDMRHGRDGGMEGMRMGPQGMWWKNPMVAQRLNLTPEQTKKMDSIFQESRIQLIDLKANVEKQEVLLEPLLSANPPDTNKAMAQIDKVAQARADLEKARARMLLGVRGVLTPDQWTTLNTRGRGFGGPGGPEAQGAPGQPPAPGTPGSGRNRANRAGAPRPPANLIEPEDIF